MSFRDSTARRARRYNPAVLPFHDDRLVEARVVAPGDGSWFVAQAVNGGATFDVHAGAPGDRVLLRPDADAPGRAEIAALLHAGPGRRTPPCALARRCGGCHWLHLDESLQRALRRLQLIDDLRAAGVATSGVPVRSVPSPSSLAFRARVRFQTAFEDGARKVGLHRLGARETLDVPRCPVLAAPAARVYAWLREELRTLAPPGLTGFEILALPHAPGALVYLNPRDVEPPDWPRLGEALLESSRGLLAGVAVRPAPAPAPAPTTATATAGSDGSIVGRRAIAGRTPAGHPIAAGARGFVQANLGAADVLADEVVRLVRPSPGMRVLELFAGTGLLGWRLAAAGADVTGLESDPLAVEAAALLPAPRGGSLRLVCGDARATALAGHGSAPGAQGSPLAAHGSVFAGHGSAPAAQGSWLAAHDAPDVVVTDPPRAGLGPLAARLADARVPRLVLVSCSTRALARDVARLCAGGYRLRELVQVDLFPQTRHAESIALLTL